MGPMASLWDEMRDAWRYNTPIGQLSRRVQVAYLGVLLMVFGATVLLVGRAF